MRLDAQGLQYKDAHSDKSLLGRVVTLVDSIVQYQNNEIMRSIGIDNKGSKALIALQGFPEQHDHLRCPRQRLVASRQICGCCLQLQLISGFADNKNSALIQADSVSSSSHRPRTGNPAADANDRGNSEKYCVVACQCLVLG